MISSIWSSNFDDVKKFPLITFINFFKNHALLILKIDRSGNSFLVEAINI